MTVPHLRRLLRLLQPLGNDEASARRPANLSRLLRCLGRMVGEERFPGPSHYFWLDGGAHAGVRLRPLVGFSRRHYSFVTWVRLEEDDGSRRPHLFSLVSEEGTALDAYFLPSSGSGGSSGGQCFTLQLEYRRNKVCMCTWHNAACVRHSY